MKWLLTVLIVLDFGEQLNRSNVHSADSEMAGVGSLSTIALRSELHAFDSWNWDVYSQDWEREWDKAQQSAVLCQKFILVWAWIFFALNTTMTMSIIYKILSVTSYPSDLSC
jgi:hypothetical protein